MHMHKFSPKTHHNLLRLVIFHLETFNRPPGNQIPYKAGKPEQWLCDDPGPHTKLEPTSPCIFLKFQTNHLVHISFVASRVAVGKQ